VQAAIFEGLRLDGPSADVVNNPGRHTPQRTSAAVGSANGVPTVCKCHLTGQEHEAKRSTVCRTLDG
jgi:hypothetical protein